MQNSAKQPLVHPHNLHLMSPHKTTIPDYPNISAINTKTT